MLFSTHVDTEALTPIFTCGPFLIPWNSWDKVLREQGALVGGDSSPGPSAIWVKGNGKAPGIQAADHALADLFKEYLREQPKKGISDDIPSDVTAKPWIKGVFESLTFQSWIKLHVCVSNLCVLIWYLKQNTHKCSTRPLHYHPACEETKNLFASLHCVSVLIILIIRLEYIFRFRKNCRHQHSS